MTDIKLNEYAYAFGYLKSRVEQVCTTLEVLMMSEPTESTKQLITSEIEFLRAGITEAQDVPERVSAPFRDPFTPHHYRVAHEGAVLTAEILANARR